MNFLQETCCCNKRKLKSSRKNLTLLRKGSLRTGHDVVKKQSSTYDFTTTNCLTLIVHLWGELKLTGSHRTALDRQTHFLAKIATNVCMLPNPAGHSKNAHTNTNTAQSILCELGNRSRGDRDQPIITCNRRGWLP